MYAVERRQSVVAGPVPGQLDLAAVAFGFYTGDAGWRLNIDAAEKNHVVDPQPVARIGGQGQTVRVVLRQRDEPLSLLGLRRPTKERRPDADDHPVLARPAHLAAARLGEIAL